MEGGAQGYGDRHGILNTYKKEENRSLAILGAIWRREKPIRTQLVFLIDSSVRALCSIPANCLGPISWHHLSNPPGHATKWSREEEAEAEAKQAR